jgi:light-regulated signal transduction histidine kinase (bacteriophytochrome)
LELALQNGSYETQDWRKRKDGSLFWATFNLSNAIKYQSPQRECIIHIQTRLEDPYMVHSVKDNGIGYQRAAAIVYHVQAFL